MKPHGFHREALEEYAKAAEDYAKASPELGGRFYDEIERLIGEACRAPTLYRRHRGCRRELGFMAGVFRAYSPARSQACRRAQANGAKVRLHICGNITHILPGIAQLNIDVLDVDHMVDLRETRAIVGSRVALCANLDPVHDILEGTPEKIRAALRRAYEESGNPFMVNAGCEIPSGTPVENLKALCEPIAPRP